MNFKKTTTISVGIKTKPIFESLERMRPSHLSFSLLLAMAVDEYVRNHSSKNSKITEYDSVVVSSKFPMILATIDKWNMCVSSLSNDDLLKLQERLTQLQNCVRKEVSKRL
jgi:hypothetical protein|tara:strand:- start:12044 stop:12376 length:333 start_codon:yes stop_codon:yes gene_type:complete